MSRLGGWVRWIGCAAVWEAGRAVCGERRLQQTQDYVVTATEDDGVGRGDNARDWFTIIGVFESGEHVTTVHTRQ